VAPTHRRADAVVSLRAITADSLRQILELRVAPRQRRGYPRSNAWSIAQASFAPDAWLRGIYADDTPVGLVLLSLVPERGEYFLWRFMIDWREQRRGLGGRAMDRVIHHVATLPRARKLYTSHLRGNPAAASFYAGLGFRYTGREDGDDLLMELDLAPWRRTEARRETPEIAIAPFEARFAGACAAILAALPDWFGIPESNAAYLADLARLPTWVALDGAEPRGVLTLVEHDPHSFEVHFLAVHPRQHRRGVGRALLEHGASWARARGGRLLHVKTLGPSHPDPFYARTRAFYRALGFVPLFESPAFWGEGNPTLVLVRSLADARPDP
jgi:ribosomal protein S18 acetylase RimI-like enzyme